MLSQRKINRIIEENSGVFKALLDFETTGRVIAKTRMNFTIDREVAKKFKEKCRKNRENMSHKIEECMKRDIS